MTHAAARRGADSGDKAYHRLFDLGLGQEGCGFLLGAAADLADHDDRLRAVILEEQIEAIDEVRAVHRIAADADAGRLAEAGGGGLRHSFIGEGARPRHNAHAARAVDMPRHDADLALVWGDDPRAVRPD